MHGIKRRPRSKSAQPYRGPMWSRSIKPYRPKWDIRDYKEHVVLHGSGAKTPQTEDSKRRAALTRWLEKFGVSLRNWERGNLRSKNLTEVPPLVPEGLQQLDLRSNQIDDVSMLKLPEGLQKLWLNNNQIKDVSGLRLPNGMSSLFLSHNNIQDVSGLRLPEGLQTLYLVHNPIPEEGRAALQVPDGCYVSW